MKTFVFKYFCSMLGFVVRGIFRCKIQMKITFKITPTEWRNGVGEKS